MKKLVAACMMGFAQLSEHWQVKPGAPKFDSEAIASFLLPLFASYVLNFHLKHTLMGAITIGFLTPL